MFDLLSQSSLLREHARAGKVVFGVNHEMRDFKSNRKKDLDLVIATPATAPSTSRSFVELAAHYNIRLTGPERTLLRSLPTICEGSVNSVLVALEAKACMTAHIKALPRFYDELNSSHLTIHGASDHAIAVGLAIINAATDFVSPRKNEFDLKIRPAVISHHRQPNDTARTIEKVKELPRRTKSGQDGFDAFGIVVLDFWNNVAHRPTVVNNPPAPDAADIFFYDQMIGRITNKYATSFSGI
ncbi:MAG TPA: hypothetical protein VIO57_09675 [Chloroflexota bacterium]